MYKIISIINNICNKLAINYKSPNYNNYQRYKKDAKILSDIYLRLKIIIGELEDVKERYPELKNDFNIDIFDLDKTDHHIIDEVRKLIKKGKKCQIKK